jgi:hypothetical protein
MNDIYEHKANKYKYKYLELKREIEYFGGFKWKIPEFLMSRDTKYYLRPLKYQEKNRINEAKKEAEIARKEDEDFKNLSKNCQNKYYNKEKEILEHNKRVHEENKYTTGPEEPKKIILTKKIFFEKYCKKINDRYICLTDEELQIKEQQEQQ